MISWAESHGKFAPRKGVPIRVLGYIPARSGSVSVPDKNIRPLCGLPLAAYTIRAAQASGAFAELLVSTDSPEYLRILAPFGVRTDYRRPAELSQAESPTRPGMMHALDWYSGRGLPPFDAVMVLQPTAPFRTPEHIAQAIALLESQPSASCVVAIARLHDHHPARIKKLREGLWLEDFCVPEPDGSRRQDLTPPAYIRNGTIYLSRLTTLRDQSSILGNRICAFEMPEANSINVDTPFDFLVAESALNYPDYRGELAFFRELAVREGRAGAPAPRARTP